MNVDLSGIIGTLKAAQPEDCAAFKWQIYLSFAIITDSL